MHGHIHESGGERTIGKTICLNPGSEANHGILRGYLVDIGPKGVERTLRVEGEAAPSQTLWSLRSRTPSACRACSRRRRGR